MGIQVLTWDMKKNAAVLNVIPPLFPLLTFVYIRICGLKGILSTSCVIFSYSKLLSISVLTFIK